MFPRPSVYPSIRLSVHPFVWYEREDAEGSLFATYYIIWKEKTKSIQLEVRRLFLMAVCSYFFFHNSYSFFGCPGDVHGLRGLHLHLHLLLYPFRTICLATHHCRDSEKNLVRFVSLVCFIFHFKVGGGGLEFVFWLGSRLPQRDYSVLSKAFIKYFCSNKLSEHIRHLMLFKSIIIKSL